MNDAAEVPEIRMTGATVVGLRRVYYVFRGEIDTDEGAIEFTFADGTVLLFDSGRDGSELRIGHEPWIDPFAKAPTPENDAYIAQYGKYTAFDVSEREPYSGLIGARVEHVDGIRLPDGRLSGLVVTIAGRTLRFETVADEMRVRIS